jgi:methylated-DNA-[protein]-cysteine S-methyltransferase
MTPKTNNPHADQALAAWLGDAAGLAAPDPLTAALDQLYAAGPGGAATAQAQARLRQALAAAGQRTEPLWYDVLPASPIGPVYVAVSPRGLFAVRFGVAERVFVDDLRRAAGRAPMRSAARAGAAARQVGQYLAGRRQAFDLPVDLGAVTSFQREVLLAACQIPRGQVRTYADLARQIGRPKAARAVGQALASNPVPIVVPCHRVLAADGSLRGYTGGGGLRTKRQLLVLEGVAVQGV